MGTESPLTETVGMSIDGEWASIADMIRAVRQQRAASVRVVEVLQEAESFNRSVDYPINIKAGQELAIIERRAEAAAGEGEKA